MGDNTGPFPEPVALNVVPWAGSLRADGWSSEEMKVRDETRKILGLPKLPVAVTCVRVPVVTAHSLTLHARFESEVTVAKAREILATAPGVVLFDEPGAGEFPTPRMWSAPTRPGSDAYAGPSTTRPPSNSSSAATTCARAPP